jgi:hypothetical protein
MIPLRLMVSASSWPKLKSCFDGINWQAFRFDWSTKGTSSQTAPCFNMNQLACYWIRPNIYLPSTSAAQPLSGIVRHDSCPVSRDYKVSETIVIVCDKVTTAFSCHPLQQTVVEGIDQCKLQENIVSAAWHCPLSQKIIKKAIVSDAFRWKGKITLTVNNVVDICA